MRMVNLLEEIALAFSFLSRLPIQLGNIKDWEVKVKKMPAYFPIVGYAPGFMYYVGSLLQSKYPNLSVLISLSFVSLGFYFFDLFHFDGLLDMFDGFLNQSSKERRLEIMSKGNVGPFAVFYGTLYVIVFWELFKRSNPIVFLFGSVFGRYTMDVVMLFSKPAKPTGLGALFFPFNKILVFYAMITTLPLVLLGVKLYTLSLIISWIVGIIIALISKKKIDGVTGDVLGGSCLIGQMITILSLACLTIG